MASKLPYMLSTGLIPKIFEKIEQARRPDRFTQDFLETKLGHSGGSARAIIPLLKRMGLVASDGAPTKLYDQFRNSDTQGAAVAEGMRNAFSELFERNEYVYELPREKLSSLVVEITGSAKDDRPVQAIVATFLALNEFADFDAPTTPSEEVEQQKPVEVPIQPSQQPRHQLPLSDNVDLRVGYTINLNLPETDNPEVFNAIFKALRENLLSN